MSEGKKEILLGDCLELMKNISANNTPVDVIRWRQYMAKYHNNNLPLDGRWSADGYINQDGWWFNEFEDLFISSIENEITLDEFISFFYPHKKLKKFRIWEIKI